MLQLKSNFAKICIPIESDFYTKGDKNMKILVITSSPRKNGNSNILADNFIKGAQENNHQIVRIDVGTKQIHPCIACDHCSNNNGKCIYKDDFYSVRENILDADMVVFATPMYYFGISAQLKTVIDRFYAINEELHKPKKAALLMTYADTVEKEAEPTTLHFEAILNYLGWENIGEVIASGVWEAGSINNTHYPQQAYDLGKSL